MSHIAKSAFISSRSNRGTEGQGALLQAALLDGEQKPVATFDGREVINLSSNNYLGLTTNKH